MTREEGYIDSLNLNIKTQEDIRFLLNEYEIGKLTKDEIIALLFMANSVSYSKGYKKGFESGISKNK